MDLTERQEQILQYIIKEVRSKGYPPTVREIGKEVGLRSSSTVYGYLKTLEEKGYIKRDPTKPRAIEIISKKYKLSNPSEEEEHKRMVKVPIIGDVAAGIPIFAAENQEDFMPLPYDFVQNDMSFILRVRGESMIQAGICDGDFIIVRQQNTAQNGEIIVALIDDEATVKTFYKESNYIRLQPENDTMEPIIVNDVKILGKVTGLFRKL